MMVDPSGSETLSYDAGGRVTQSSKILGSQTFNTGYQYNATGEVTQTTYPSGRVVAQTYDQVGQLCAVAPSSAGCSTTTNTYANSLTYDATGNLTGFNYGNSVAASRTYSSARGQLASLQYKKGTQTYFSLSYWYQYDQFNCSQGTVGNNGQIQCLTDGVDSGRSASYSYDSLSRLNSAATNGSSGFPKWGLAENYDRFGNRLSQSVTAGSGPSVSLGFTRSGGSNVNQPVGYTYDASGNLTIEPSVNSNYTYDAENRMVAFSGSGGAASYTYDGDGMRVQKAVQGGTATVSVYDGSQVIAEYDNGALPSSPSREYVFAGDQMLAMISGGVTTYYHPDHLSTRLTTDSSGAIVEQEGHYPFGEMWYQQNGTNNWFFTTYKRDQESGLDFALARYYNSRTGTFCSADPLAGDPSDPQSWNRYPYGRNDPIDITDPSGKAWWNWVLDIGLGVTAALLPELAPAWFGAGAAGETTDVTVTMLGQTFNWTSTSGAISAAVVGGGITGATVASATQSPAQQPSVKVPKKNCPPLPAHPDWDKMDQDVNLLKSQNPAQRLLNFKLLEEKGSVWDFKTVNPAWDDFGNFHYGYVGSGIGYSDSTIMRAGGYVYWRDHPATRGNFGNPFKGTGNYGEPPAKAAMIRNGIDARKKGCKYD